MEEDGDGDGDEEKQIRILQETTGMPREAFDGNIFLAYWIVK
jgi:U3 small nucleolar RNA-associated protein 14